MKVKPVIIAIDGPAASGKGTLAVKIAHYYGFAHLDTGLLYRAVAQMLIDRGQSLQDEQAGILAATELDAASLADPRLRSRSMGENASIVAVLPGVRQALVDYQRRFSQQPPGAVLDGRDIGTVICPDADIKLFITATVEERAQRRFRELEKRGAVASYEDILADLKKRDARDASRAEAPLRNAEDAILLDTTCLDPEAVLAQAISIIDKKMAL